MLACRSLPKFGQLYRIMRSLPELLPWCKNNNIPVSTFWSRQKKVYEAYTQKDRTQFIEVSVEPESNANSPMISVRRNDFTIDINNGADEATITAVLRAMKNA